MDRSIDQLSPNEARCLLTKIIFFEGLRKRPSYYGINTEYKHTIDNNVQRVWMMVVGHTETWFEKTVLSVPGIHLDKSKY